MLSVCIPTYNRFRFLKWTLQRLRADFPEAQIVVSDNASTDDTRTVQTYVDYGCQAENLGAFPNMLTALSLARGEYAVYCGDDDYLLPDEVDTGIAYLEAHPKVAAYCAPCEIWNEVDGTPFWNAFTIPEAVTFDASQGMALFNFIIQRHIWPEHILFRTPVPLKPRTRAYWAFADIPDILAAGAIHFAQTPFYRNLLVHPIGDRVQLGNEQCLTDFDEYRAGLEVMAYGLFGGQLAYATRQRIHEMIQWFICQRLDAAYRLHTRAGRTTEAQMIAKRLAIASPARDIGQPA